MTRIGPRVALLIGAPLLVYWNGLSTPFLLDDYTAILENPSIESLTWPGPLVTPSDTPVARRPLVNLSFAVNYSLGERSVRGYHLANLLIHVLAALVLFGIVRRTLRRPPLDRTFGAAATSLAWVCALVWLLHPLNSEVVEYVTQRTQSLFGLFYLLTLYCAIRSAEARRDGRWDVGAVLCCAAGMMSKEAMVTAPIVVALYDRVFVFDSFKALVARRARLYAGLAASWVILAALMQAFDRTSAGLSTEVSSWSYLLNQARMIPRYLYLAAWPRALVVDYGATHPVALSSVVVPGALLLAALILVIAGLIRWPRAAFAPAWFFITIAPASSFVPIATEVAAERRMYLPLAGLVVMAVIAAYSLTPRTRGSGLLLRVGCVLIVAGLAFGTVLRNREYADPVQLAEHTVSRWSSGRAHVHLGTLYGERGDKVRELREFRQAAETYAPGHYPLGVALVENQQVDEGLAHLRTFIALRPRHAAVIGARDLIGRVLVDRGDLDGASREFEWLMAEDRSNARPVVLLADVRLRQTRTADAVTLYERAHRLDSGLGRVAAVMARYGTALASIGRLAEAERVFAEGAHNSPGDAALQKLWGRSLAATGRFALAAERFRRARALAPDDAEAGELVTAIERRLGSASMTASR